jgi:hypothetical protein
LNDPLFLIVYFEAIWRELENITLKFIKDILS